jgi:hypothetical protein
MYNKYSNKKNEKRVEPFLIYKTKESTLHGS